MQAVSGQNKKNLKGKAMKYQLAEWLFSKELDEAYELGIREGASVIRGDVLFRLKTHRAQKELTKARKEGYAKAVEVVENYE